MKLLVCGDRNWTNSSSIFKLLQEYKEKYGEDLVVIEGEAPGADTMARIAAEELNVKFEPYPANWRLFGKQAGPVRNAQMLREGKPDEVHAFHSNIEMSKGTKDMVNISKRKGVKVIIHEE